MGTVPQHTKPNFLLKPFNLKRMSVGSLRIPIISANECPICLVELFLTGLVRKIKSFQVFNEHIIGDILDSGNITAFIHWFGWVIFFSGCVSDNSYSTGSTIFALDCFVVVALNPEYKIAPSGDHFLINLFVFVELF